MNIGRHWVSCTLVAMGVFASICYSFHSNDPGSDPVMDPFKFEREGADSPEEAAKVFFHGCAMESPKHFVRHLLLGVCDGPIDTLQKFAECLHRTEFRHGDESFTVHDLPKRMNRKKPIRVIASKPFDTEDEKVAALKSQMVSTYYGEFFQCVDVIGESYDGREYQTRFVIAKVKEHWYAIPRCRSSRSFYAIADAMEVSE